MKYLQLILLLILFAACTSQKTDFVDLIIKNVNIIDVETGIVSENKHLVINGSEILDILESSSVLPPSVTHIDGKGKYVIPGLWDMHVHMQDTSYLDMFLNFGVIGVRDMGGCVNLPTDGCESLCPDELNVWKQKISSGELIGPEIYIAGPNLSGTGWPSSLPVNTISEVNESFDKLLQMQVDFVKVYEQIPTDAYNEISKLSKANDIDFVGHISENMLLSEVSNLGQKSIEHLREQLVLCFTDNADSLEVFLRDDNYTEEDRAFVKPWIDDDSLAILMFQKNKTWVVPTLATTYAQQRYKDSLWIQNPLRNVMPETVTKAMNTYLNRMKHQSNTEKESIFIWWDAQKKTVKRLRQNNIGLLAGSDSACEGGIPGFSLHEELQLLVEAGLTPLEALQTATINPATYFDLPNQGKIKPAFLANLILLNNNPLESINNSLSINMVIKNGVIIKRQ